MPGEWENVTLGGVAEVNPESVNVSNDAGQIFSYIDISSVDNGSVNWAGLDSFQLKNAPSRARRAVRSGDFLLCNVRPLLGAHALISGENSTGRLVASTGFSVIRGTSRLSTELFHHLAFSSLVTSQIWAREVGSSYPAITERDVSELKLNLPPLPEQRRIAAILDTLDRTIEATQRIVSKLQAARQGLLHDLLTRGLDEQGQLRDPQRHPEQFKDTALGRVPVGWEMLSVAATAAPTPGSSTIGPFGSNLTAIDYRESGKPVVFVRDIKEDGFIWKSEVYLGFAKAKTLQAHAVHAGDVLITKMGDPPCISCVYPDWMTDGIITADVIRITIDPSRLSPDWLSLFINSPQVAKQVRWISGGVTRSKVTLKDFRGIMVAIPSRNEQARILRQVEQSLRRIVAEQAQLAKLQTLKRGLMEDLLTGRVRVAGAGRGFEDKDAGAAVQPVTAELPSSGPLPMPPPLPAAPQHRAMYRAGAGASPEAMSEWTQQLWDAAQSQQVGPYSHAALDAVLPQLAAASSERAGVARIPELLARAGVRFMLLPHPRGSKASGAAFYLNEERTQPVVGLSLRYPLLDVFWFNLFHELGHIRLGHEPVLEETLDSDSPDPKSPDEQAADAFAREQLIPEAVWQPFLKGAQHDSNRIKRLARGLNRHPATVAGRLAFDTQDWRRFNTPELRPNIEPELRALMAQLGTMQERRDP